jgi:proteasome lid subunit RPN8/RPN11
MPILLPSEIERGLIDALQRAGSQEIGGIVMGESLGDEVFRVKKLTVQYGGGTIANFVRKLSGVVGPLSRFFRETEHQYTRFNYIGEWHSHPSFSLRPSARDHATMREIVEDRAVGANFAILMIVRFREGAGLEASITLYLPDGRSSVATFARE